MRHFAVQSMTRAQKAIVGALWIGVVTLMLAAGCKKKAGHDRETVFKDLPKDHACGALVDNATTCVADGVAYTCILHPNTGEGPGSLFYCAPREVPCPR